MVDFVFAILPNFDALSPLMGPHLLKSILSKNNVSSKIFDFNLDFSQRYIQKPKSSEQGRYLNDDMFGGVFSNVRLFNNLWKNEGLEELAEHWIRQIQTQNPKWVGVCLFTFESQLCGKYFLRLLRKKMPKVKVVIGGPFALFCGERFKQGGLTDHYIAGEGEDAIVQLVNGNTNFPGIDSLSKNVDLNDIPIPDYSDIDLNEYLGLELFNEKRDATSLELIGSRGCVRDCTFCDIKENWPNFQWRPAESIISDIEILKHDVDPGVFFFVDSLVNGHYHIFNDMCQQLGDKIENGEIKDLAWQGQFIIRRKHQINNEHFDNIARSGADCLYIGIETGSEKVRSEMKKNFTNEDVMLTLAQLKRVGVKCIFLMLVGYPTETAEDFEETLKLIRQCKEYANNTIADVRMYNPMQVMRGTHVWDNKEALGIEFDKKGHWFTEDNTINERLKRWAKLIEVSDECGFNSLWRMKIAIEQQIKERI